MADIHRLPGAFVPALEPDERPEALLRAALDEGYADLVIVGRTLAGEVVAFYSCGDEDRAIGLLQRGVTYLASKPPIPTQDDPEAG